MKKGNTMSKNATLATSEEFAAILGTFPEKTTLDQDKEYALNKLNELKSKSSTIRYLTAEGWTRTRISKSMGILYQHVRNVQLQQLKKTSSK